MTEAAFVTGGSGFTGGKLVQRLVAEGRPVCALARSDAAAERVSAALIGGKPVVFREFECTIDITKARPELGYTPSSTMSRAWPS